MAEVRVGSGIMSFKNISRIIVWAILSEASAGEILGASTCILACGICLVFSYILPGTTRLPLFFSSVYLLINALGILVQVSSSFTPQMYLSLMIFHACVVIHHVIKGMISPENQ